MKLVFVTHNKHKLKEVKQMLPEGFSIMSLDDLNYISEIDETAETLEGNALIKSKTIYDAFGVDCFADDTGLEVEHLNGAPGVHSARYAREGHDFEANLVKLMLEMEGAENRRARFRTVISLLLNGTEHQFEGIVNGSIIAQRKGSEGFGYDPVFVPEGYTETFAEMDP
ncbi:MAG: non-canonical purine NTP pyrophosphatase, RdgB/HAM1 family, partial [Marinilabiliales bacterium]